MTETPPNAEDLAAFRSTVHTLLHPMVCTLATRRALVAVHLRAIPIALSDDTRPHRAWWPCAGVLDVVNPMDAYTYLVDATIDALSDRVANLARRTRTSERDLWAEVAAIFTDLGPQHMMTHPEAARRECETFARAAQGTPLGCRLRYVEFEYGGTARRLVQRPTCCLSGGATSVDHTRQGADRWRGHCVSCPRLPRDETIRLARRELAAAQRS